MENPRSFFIAQYFEFPVSVSDGFSLPVQLSPNPASSVLNTHSDDILIVEIKDMNGKIMGRYNASTIDVSNLQNGMYIVTTEQDGKRGNQLISVMH